MSFKRATRRYGNPTIPQIRRMTELRCAGLSIQAATIVVNLDWSTDFTPNQVRYFTGRYGGVKGSPKGARLSWHNEKSVGNLNREPAA